MTSISGTSSSVHGFFEPWEVLISDWPSALDQINLVLSRATDRRQLTWRGVVDARWSLHSSLHRHFLVRGVQPTEAKLVQLEERILDRARKRWRFDQQPALEIFAHMQHYGGPTRLIDITYNPLIALWFAVETKHHQDGSVQPDIDGRLFAFDTTKRQIELDLYWGGRDLPWRQPPGGWRHDLPFVWRPPSFNERIPAQNSGFLLGGSLSHTTGGNRQYRKGPGAASTMGLWKVGEAREATSVNLRMNALDRNLVTGATPTFTIRVSASAKPNIRRKLEEDFGFNASTIYPDLFGLANHVAIGPL